MKITGTLLLAGIVALVAFAPSAYTQRQRSERELLNDVLLDMVRLTEKVDKLQINADSKGAKTLQLVEQIYESALLLEGLHPNPAEMVGRIQRLMEAAARKS